MDARQFDSLTKRLTHRRSRRGLVGGTLTALLGLSAREESRGQEKEALSPLQEAQTGQVQDQSSRWDGL